MPENEDTPSVEHLEKPRLKRRLSTGCAAATFGVFLIVFPLMGAQPENTLPPAVPDKSSGTEIVRQAGDLYDAGRLSDAEHFALKALDQPDGLSKLERSELYKLLAFCSIANDDEENGRRHFVSALRSNPNLSPDPISWSPKVRRVFDKAREEFLQVVQIEVEKRLSIEADLCRRASYKSLYSPGLGQDMKGQTNRGLIYGALFWGSVALFIYSEAALPKARDDYHSATAPKDVSDRYRHYRSLSHLAVISGGAIVVTYSFTFFDALWSLPPIDQSKP